MTNPPCSATHLTLKLARTCCYDVKRAASEVPSIPLGARWFPFGLIRKFMDHHHGWRVAASTRRPSRILTGLGTLEVFLEFQFPLQLSSTLCQQSLAITHLTC